MPAIHLALDDRYTIRDMIKKKSYRERKEEKVLTLVEDLLDFQLPERKCQREIG